MSRMVMYGSTTKARSRVNEDLYAFYKRAVDIVFSALMLILLFPVMVVVTIMVRFDSPGSPIFAQKRVGTKRVYKDGQVTWEIDAFTAYKFRTMYEDADVARHRAFMSAFIKNDDANMAALRNNGASSGADDSSKYKMTDDPRVTRVGRFLRKSSLDELPQFWNVLKGDMTLVGPRPAIDYEVEMYEAWHRQRLMAKPGLTGVWQISARSSVDFDEMVRLDIWYIEHQSLWLDMVILFRTPFAVLSRKGAA